MKYALYFVPRELEREKLSLERRRLCKRFQNRKAVMYPVHLTLVREFVPYEYKGFLSSLRAFCAEHKPIKLVAQAKLSSRNGWGGVEIKDTPALRKFQLELEEMTSEHARIIPASFDAHISLVYAKGLPSLSNRSSPVKKLLLDRVTICLQTSPGTPFRIVKHVDLGKT